MVDKGLRQGCCLSPILLKIYLDQSLQKWKRQCQDVGISTGDKKLYTLHVADDQLIIAEDEDDLGYVVRKLKMYYEHMGLKVNMEKAEYLVMGTEK
jgi:hypothetical protein